MMEYSLMETREDGEKLILDFATSSDISKTRERMNDFPDRKCVVVCRMVTDWCEVYNK